MSIETAPAYLITEEAYRLRQERGHTLPETFAEIECDVLLAKFAEAIQPGRPAPTKASVAEVVIEATRIAHERAKACVCPCGHRYSEHLGSAGCLESGCRCTARRPHAVELAPAGGEAR